MYVQLTPLTTLHGGNKAFIRPWALSQLVLKKQEMDKRPVQTLGV